MFIMLLKAVKTVLVKQAAKIATDALAGKLHKRSTKFGQKATQAITHKGSGYKEKRTAKNLDYNNFTSVKKNILHHDTPRFNN
jgi:hypothetical protein